MSGLLTVIGILWLANYPLFLNVLKNTTEEEGREHPYRILIQALLVLFLGMFMASAMLGYQTRLWQVNRKLERLRAQYVPEDRHPMKDEPCRFVMPAQRRDAKGRYIRVLH